MSNLVVQNQPMKVFSEQDIEVIKTVIAPGLEDNELKLFIGVAQRTGLDPFARQIWCKAKGEGKNRRFSIQATIDGFRIVAERSGKYRGQVGPYWCGKDGKWVDVWLENTPPVAARIGVLRADFNEPLWAVAKFNSYAQKGFSGELNPTWAKMPEFMVSKCAEALALRRAFPHDLSGIYAPEEMEQAGFDAVEIDAAPVYTEGQYRERLNQVTAAPSPTPGEAEIAAEFSEASNVEPELSSEEMGLAKEMAKAKSRSGQRISVSNFVDSMEQIKKAKARAEANPAAEGPELPNANYKIKFGKHLGKTLQELNPNTLRYMIDDWYPKLERPSAGVQEFYKAGCEYLNAKNNKPVLPPSSGAVDSNDELPF